MKYIDAEKLKAEIEKLQRATAITMEELQMDEPSESMRGELDAYDEIFTLINSLQQEQPEVDFEKEYTEFVVSDPVYSKLVNIIVGKSIARHFYEFGLNARKEE